MSAPLGRVLIADDQVNILDALKLLLGGEGYEVATAASPAELVNELRTHLYAVDAPQRGRAG